MTTYPCDADPEDPGPDLVDLLERSLALAKGQRHLKPAMVWHPIRVEAAVTPDFEVWVAPAGTPLPTTYPPSMSWTKLSAYNNPKEQPS